VEELSTSGKVIVITSGKGGVGKTTTSANLGMALASMGKKVVLVDADFGLRNLDLLLVWKIALFIPFLMLCLKMRATAVVWIRL
jgi:MinD superfamily P-loop ATPase